MDNKMQFNIQEYITMFLRRKWFFIVPFILTLAGSIIAGFVMPKTYQAQAVILVEEEGMVNPLLRNIAVTTSVSERLHKFREEILAWPRLLQLVEILEMNKDVENPLELEAKIKAIRERIQLRMSGNDIITITYQDDDPYITQKVVTTLCDILIEKNINAQGEEADSAISFIEKQLEIYKAKLETSEEALRKFKERYGLQMPLATQLNDELAQLEAELTRSLVDCTEEHPRVKELRRRISSLKEKRTQQIRQAAASMSSGDYSEYVDIAESIPKQEQELARLTRDRAVNEEIYSMLLERLETARISQQLESSENKTKFKVVEPARLPLKPISPDKVKLDLLGIALGGLVGFGCVYVLEYTDTSFKNADQVKEALNIPVLGSISEIVTEDEHEKKRKKTAKIVFAAVILAFFAIIAAIVIAVVSNG